VLSLLRRLAGRIDPADDKALGRAGERAAARLLRRSGYRILGRNVRLEIGEADLVCLAPDRATIVVVEVKTRRRGANRSLLGEIVPPEASVHSHKRRKLGAVARALARSNGWLERPVRIDVVAVEWPSDGAKPTLRHHIDAVI
jgi:putative endonuclease